MVREGLRNRLATLRLKHLQLRNTEITLHQKLKLVVAAVFSLNVWLLWWMDLRALGVFAAILFEIYVLIPTIIWHSPVVRNSIVFMTWLGPRRRRTKRALQPGEEGVASQARHRFIDTGKERHRLGAWEILSQGAGKVEVAEVEGEAAEAREARWEAAWRAAWRSGDPQRPVFLLLHGQGGHRGGKTRVGQCNMLTALGFHVVSFDYRGFGDSTGTPTPEDVVHDTIYAYQHLKALAGPHPVIVYGHSLGSGVAARTADLLGTMDEGVAGLVLDAAFSSLTAALRHHTLFAPYRVSRWTEQLLLSAFDRADQGFPSAMHVARLDCPILILHAKDDPLIPFALAENLRSAVEFAGGKVDLVLFDRNLRLGHNDVYKAPQIPRIFRQYLTKGGWAGEILVPLNDDDTQSPSDELSQN